MFIGIDVEVRDFVAERVNASDLADDTVAIMIPPDAFMDQTMTDTNIVFSTFNTSDLYPLFNKTFPQFGVASSVVSATVTGSENSIVSNITIVLRLNIKVHKACLFILSSISLPANHRTLSYLSVCFGMSMLQVCFMYGMYLFMYVCMSILCVQVGGVTGVERAVKK